MREVLGNYSDYKHENSRIDRILSDKHGHIVYKKHTVNITSKFT